MKHTKRLLTCLAFSTSLGSLAAEQAPPSSTAENASGDVLKMETFTVTGSNIRMSTSEADRSSLPVDFIPASKFELTSGESVSDLLRNQPFVSGANQSPATDENGGGRSSLNLRGLGDKYTLVLVNGRRFAGEDIADIGALPVEAVKSVEVLKSGASAVFGSDAVAGVVNVKLKDNYQGAKLTASYGNTTDKDAGFWRTALLFGIGAGKWHIVGSASVQERNGIERQDREITASRDFRRWGGLDRRNASVGSPNRITVAGYSSPLTIDTSKVEVGQTATSVSDFTTYSAEQAYSGNEIGTLPGFKRRSAHWQVEYEVFGDRLKFFTDGYADNRDQIFVAVNPGAIGTLTVPASNPYNPFGKSVTVAYVLQPNESDPIQRHFQTNNIRGSFGARGEWRGFAYEAGYTRYKQTVREEIRNNLVTALLTAAVNRTDATAFNPFGNGANSAAQLAGLMPVAHTRTLNGLETYDAKVAGPLFSIPAGEVRFAAGAEHREAEYELAPDANRSTLRYQYAGGPISYAYRSREVDAYFGELRVPVYTARKADRALLGSVELSGAARREKYSDFGSATVSQVSARVGAWSDSLVLRSSYAEAFKAPSVADLTTATTVSTQPGYYDPVRGAVLPSDVITGGNPNLKPEKAKTYNLGIVFTPKRFSDFTIKADYWKIDIRDVIATPNAQSVLYGTSPGGSVTRDPATLYPTIDARINNGGTRRASGVDFGASYRLPQTAFGKLVLDFSATQLLTLEDQTDSAVVEYLGNYSNGSAFPEFRAVLGALWEKGRWESGFFLHYTEGYRDYTAGLFDRRVEDYWTADLQLAYTVPRSSKLWNGLLRGTRFYAGVENLWNEALPFVASSTEGWDRSLADYRGRYVYVGLSKEF